MPRKTRCVAVLGRLGLLMILSLLAPTALAEQPMLKLDFETARLQRKLLEGATEPGGGRAKSIEAILPTVGSGITVERAHRDIAAGERWAIIRLKLDAKGSPKSTVHA